MVVNTVMKIVHDLTDEFALNVSYETLVIMDTDEVNLEGGHRSVSSKLTNNSAYEMPAEERKMHPAQFCKKELIFVKKSIGWLTLERPFNLRSVEREVL